MENEMNFLRGALVEMLTIPQTPIEKIQTNLDTLMPFACIKNADSQGVIELRNLLSDAISAANYLYYAVIFPTSENDINSSTRWAQIETRIRSVLEQAEKTAFLQKCANHTGAKAVEYMLQLLNVGKIQSMTLSQIFQEEEH